MTPHAVAESQVFSFCLNTRVLLLRFLLKQSSLAIWPIVSTLLKDYDVLLLSRRSWLLVLITNDSLQRTWDRSPSPRDPSESKCLSPSWRKGQHVRIRWPGCAQLQEGFVQRPSRTWLVLYGLSPSPPVSGKPGFRGACLMRSVPAWPFPTRLCPSGSGGLGRKLQG